MQLNITSKRSCPKNPKGLEAVISISRAVGINSKETTLFVIQRFMDKFNAAAEALKNDSN
jgi:hypothetical protein